MKDIPIIYEDDNLLAINKPAGLSVHGDGFNHEPTLVDWLLEKYPDIAEVGESMFTQKGEEIKKPGIVHRLDKDTSGVLIVAKNQETFLFLKNQFQEHSVRKTYRLIVDGKFNFKPGEMEKTINLPIGRSRQDPRLRVASTKAVGNLRPAVTRFRVVESFDRHAYVEAWPETGRTHQLRAHFKADGHPIVCDSLYNPKGSCPPPLARQALHAFSLEIEVPGEGGRCFEAPLPEDMAKTLSVLSNAWVKFSNSERKS